MNTWVAGLLIVVSGVVLFSQFGRRLSAKHSLVWMAVFAFLVVAAVVPEWLIPVAHAVGFQLVSNFVLAGLIFFSFLEILQQSAQNVKVSRKLREVISTAAAQRFLEQTSKNLPAQPQSTAVKVLVVTPCFNEEESLPATLEALSRLKQAHPEIDYCVVNDGSRDRSLSLLKKSAPNNHATHLSNAGVGAALLTGFLAARELDADYVVQCDADGQHPFDEIPRLVAEARQLRTDLLIGSRFASALSYAATNAETHSAAHPSNKTKFAVPDLESTSLSRWMGGRIISLTLGLFGRHARIKDPTSGFRVYSRRAFAHLTEHMPEEYPEPESIALLLQAGMSVAETPVSMQPRAGGVSSLSGFKSAQFMIKVSTALIALRLRHSAHRLPT